MFYTQRKLQALLVIIIMMTSANLSHGQSLETLQPFAMEVQSTYGGGIRPNEGLYFGMDAMFMYYGKPDQVEIGNMNPVGADKNPYWVEVSISDAQGDENIDGSYNIDRTVTVGNALQNSIYNSYNTGLFNNEWVCGQRYEVGYMYRGNGINVGIYDINPLTQDFTLDQAMVIFDTPLKTNAQESNGTTLEGPIGTDLNGNTIYRNLGVMFTQLNVRNRTETFSFELNYTRRLFPRDMLGMRYGIWEIDCGVRYLRFKESFDVSGTGGALDTSYWNTEAINNIVGPQLGVRYFTQYGRWQFDFKGKFLAGFNNQSVSQIGILGTSLSAYKAYLQELEEGNDDNNDNAGGTDDTDNEETVETVYLLYNYQGLAGTTGYPNLGAQSFNYKYSDTLFSPVGELQFNAKIQLTRLVNLKLGWTGMYIGNIARPSEMVKYSLPGDSKAMGVDMDKNDSSSFVHGFNIGFEINR